MEQHTGLSTQHVKAIYQNRLSSDHIRLLKVLPGNEESPLQCYLIEVSLATAPAYEAISYTWGDPSVTESILCNIIKVNITVSLVQALRRLRFTSDTSKIDTQNDLGSSEQSSLPDITSQSTPLPTDRTRLLWADALCINQQDPTEKGHQVQLMRKVYSHATRVIVCLGPGDPEIVATAVAAIKTVKLTVSDPLIPSELSFGSMEALMSEQGFRSPWIPSMDHFFASPWFQRIWCVQEVVLAQEITFILGDEEVHASELMLFCVWYSEKVPVSFYSFYRESSVAMVSITSRFIERLNNIAEWHKHPLRAFHAFRRLAATDPRDKVYGLLGLMGNVSYEVNYDKSIAGVYADTVWHSIDMSGDLSCLSYVQHDDKYDPSVGFPSWVPRWDVRTSTGKFYICSMQTVCLKVSLPARDPAQPGILQTKGVFFEEVVVTKFIDSTANSLSFQNNDQEFRNFLLSFFREAQTGRSQSTLTLLTLAATLTTGLMTVRLRDSTQLAPTEVESDLGKQFLADFLAFFRTSFPDEIISPPIELPEGSGEIYAEKTFPQCAGRRLFRTTGGYLGLGPGSMMEGDIVVLLEGGTMPYILRPINGSTSEFYFMGECYIQDIMFEKGVELLKQKRAEMRTFRLV